MFTFANTVANHCKMLTQILPAIWSFPLVLFSFRFLRYASEAAYVHCRPDPLRTVPRVPNDRAVAILTTFSPP